MDRINKSLRGKSLFDEIESIISRFREIEIGYLFGSFLKEESFEDIDVAILLLEGNRTPYENFKLTMKIGRLIERSIRSRYEVDVKILNTSPLSFQYQVIREGNPVFIRNELNYIRYETHLLSEYLDYQETLRWFNKKFLERIS